MEREVPGAHPQMGDGLQPRRPLHGDSERVGDVDAVRPGLHQAGGGHRGPTHRWAEPVQFAAVGHGPQRGVQVGTGQPPGCQKFGRRQFGRLGGAVVDEGGDRGLGSDHQGVERRLIGDREQRHPVGPPQVPDLMGDGPPRGRRHQRPLLGRQWRDEGVERLALGVQIVDHRASQAHVGQSSRRGAGRGARAGRVRPGIPPSLPAPAAANGRWRE